MLSFNFLKYSKYLYICLLSVQVPAGLQVELQVQLFAMCAVRAGGAESKTSFSQDITIQTETEILYLPVTANILSTLKEMLTVGILETGISNNCLVFSLSNTYHCVNMKFEKHMVHQLAQLALWGEFLKWKKQSMVSNSF